jgi:hypothetical protein
MLSVTCLIQHLVVTLTTLITQVMILLYLFAIVAFLLLAMKKVIAPVLIIISAVFSMCLQVIWMREYAFSLVVLSLFLYHVIIIVALFAEGIPAVLKRKKLAAIEEEHKWLGKI